MRIAQVAPLIESVPPKHYGGTERIVSYLTEELVRAGHDVTLFASGDSITRARLIPACRGSLRLNKYCVDHLAHHLVMMDQVLEHARNFDVIHFHTDYLHFPVARYVPVPHVTTLHGRLDLPDLIPVYDRFRDIPVISISNAQRKPLPWANWAGTIYHGLPPDLFRFQPNPGTYLAFLGRISPEKRADRAIEIAKRAGMPLKIAAKVDRVDKRYFKRVIAYDGGAVPEVIEDGQTGFIAKNLEDAADAVHRVSEISRTHCRKIFEKRFTVTRMARDYVRIYRRTIDRRLRGLDRCIGLSRREIRANRPALENSKMMDAQLPS